MTEKAVQFGEWKSLAGVVTHGDTQAAGVDHPAVIFLDAGLLHRIGPNRLSVRMARHLSAAGVTSLRFDHAGIGDSPPRQDRKPALQSTVLETQEAMDYLTSACGATRFVLVGLCSGADVAFRTAKDDPRVVGLVLLDGYSYKTQKNQLVYVAGNLLQPRAWPRIASTLGPMLKQLVRRLLPGGGDDDGPPAPVPGFGYFIAPPQAEAEATLQALLQRDVSLLVIYTLSRSYNYRTQFQDMFPSIPIGSQLQVEFFGDADHTFTLLHQQKQIAGTIEGWVVQTTWPAPLDLSADDERVESVI